MVQEFVSIRSNKLFHAIAEHRAPGRVDKRAETFRTQPENHLAGRFQYHVVPPFGACQLFFRPLAPGNVQRGAGDLLDGAIARSLKHHVPAVQPTPGTVSTTHTVFEFRHLTVGRPRRRAACRR